MPGEAQGRSLKLVVWVIVGLGLALFGTFTIGFAIFVSTIILHVPAASVEELVKIPFTPANEILHRFLWIGSPMGVYTLPFWTLLAGRKVLTMTTVSSGVVP